MPAVYRQQYDAYMASKQWASRRDAYYRAHACRCSACASIDKIHLHHLTYERMGRELDSDLTPLCEGCHARVHKLQRKEKCSIAEATRRVVMLKRRPKQGGKTPKRMTDPSKRYNPHRSPAGRSDPVNQAMAALRGKRYQRSQKCGQPDQSWRRRAQTPPVATRVWP